MIKKQFFILPVLLICNVVNIQAQVTYSPYSMLGLGEIEDQDYGRTSGMSNIAIGIRDGDYLNPLNPAAIGGLDSLKLIFDISASGKQSFFSGKGKKDNTFTGNLKKLALGFRITPRWAISLGTKPFSDVGYQIYNEEPIEGSAATKSVYLEGSGGLYELYISNGIKITDNLSLGVNTKYISGSIKQTENQSEYLFEKESQISQVYNTFGIQYFNKNWVLGATYGYKQTLSLSNKTSIYDSGYTLIQEEKNRSTNQFIPETMGVGFSYKKSKILWGMDFQYQRWNGLSSNVSNIKIVDSYKINTGFGYIPQGYKAYRKQAQIQFGASLSKSYIQVGNKDAYNYSLSTGCNLPLDKAGTLLSIAVEYGNTLSAPTSYLNESYFMFTVNCTIFEQLFKRRKIK